MSRVFPLAIDSQIFSAVRSILACRAMLSPDGKHLAYTSNESGRYDGYARQFPQGAKWQISASGGMQRTARRWKRMFYVDGDNMIAAPVELSPAFSSGTPRKLFEHEGLSRSRGHQYGVTHD